MTKTLSAEDRDALADSLLVDFPDMPDGGDVLVDALLAAAATEDDLSVSEWADRYRMIGAESGSRYPGKWRTSRVPYTRQPMDCLHPDHPARRITLKWSAQTGKSEIGVNWFGFIVDRAPASILTVLPTDGEAKKYNRVKLQPTIDASPQIRKRVAPENSRDEAASTTAFKRFAGGFDQITSATSSKGLQMISVRYLILDEASGYPLDADGRGSPIDQARARCKSYADTAKEFMPSTPGMAGECVVSKAYDEGDKRHFYLPCPHCGTFQVLRYGRMQAPIPETGNKATFACAGEDCGRSIGQDSLEWMEEQARWVPTWVAEGDEPVPAVIPPEAIEAHALEPCMGRVAHLQPSWWLWSAYSQMERWTDIWARGQAAKGDPLKEKAFTQQDLGEPYAPRTDVPDWHNLLAVRAHWPQGTVPRPASALFGFVDVQGNRFEWGVWAFGPGFRAWLIDRGIIAHAHGTEEAWRALDAIVARRWLAEGGRELDVIQWGIDTGTYTQALYDRVSRRPKLLATKGSNKLDAVPFTLSRADLRDHHGNPIAGRQINLGHIGNHDLKQSVQDGLRHLVAGPKDGIWPQTTIHLPDWIGEDELRQLTAEHLIDPSEVNAKGKKRKLAAGGEPRRWFKIDHHQPNEGLDIAVGCRALAWGAGAGQLTLEQWLERAEEAHRAPAPVAAPSTPGAALAAPAEAPAVAPAQANADDFEARFARLAAANAQD